MEFYTAINTGGNWKKINRKVLIFHREASLEADPHAERRNLDERTKCVVHADFRFLHVLSNFIQQLTQEVTGKNKPEGSTDFIVKLLLKLILMRSRRNLEGRTKCVVHADMATCVMYCVHPERVSRPYTVRYLGFCLVF